MKKRYIVFAVVLNAGMTMAQVGIGNPNPDASSTLDLSNPNDRGLKLPEATSPAGMSSSEKMMYYYQGNIYFRTNLGYNALSPWKYRFNGNISEDVFYNLGGNIGIGSTDITTSPLSKLHIETDNPISLTNNGSFMIGSVLGTNLAFNSTEIQARNAGSDANLTINEDGGDIVLGSSASPSSLQATGTVQQYNQNTATYYDLVPAGSVIMWFGTSANVPEGWAICDGSTYQRADNSGPITAPDLSGRFIVGAGDNGTNTYVSGDSGGEDEVTLTEAEMPSHTHSGSTSAAGNHSHGLDIQCASDDGGGEDDYFALGDDNAGRGIPAGAGTSAAGNHAHSLSINNTGGDTPHENRPSYYALVYIIKL